MAISLISQPPTTPPRRRGSVRRNSLSSPSSRPPLANTFTWSSTDRTRFIELVALQSLVSLPPSVSSTSSAAIAHAEKLKDAETRIDKMGAGWRILPARIERDVADYFAFLAAADCGAEYVSAACVEERIGGGMVFRLAMNQGVLNEGVPQRIIAGLKKVCRELEVASIDDRGEIESRAAVWRAIVDLETLKIVKDMKLKLRRAQKPLAAMFEEALSDDRKNLISSAKNSEQSLLSTVTWQSQSVSADNASANLEKIYELCHDVVEASDGAKSRDAVEQLLGACYCARRSRSFKAFLSSTRSPKQLAQTIDKFGRYKAACNTLVSAAIRYPEAFKIVEIKAVSPPVREAFAFPENPDTGLAKLASDLAGTSTDEACRNLTTMTGLSEDKLVSKYEELYLGRPIIHAEIQLVKFYAENPLINPPKFLGTSKKACHLCSMFLDLHGRFMVSKSHPNLYQRWTMPTIVCSSDGDVRQYASVMQQMTLLLENGCTTSLGNHKLQPRRLDNTSTFIATTNLDKNTTSFPATTMKSTATPNSQSRSPVLLPPSSTSLNAALRYPQKHGSADKENVRKTRRPSSSVVSTATSHHSTKKIQSPRPFSPANIPLLPSMRSSLAPTPTPTDNAPLLPSNSTIDTLTEDLGGVSLLPTSTTPPASSRSPLSVASAGSTSSRHRSRDAQKQYQQQHQRQLEQQEQHLKLQQQQHKQEQQQDHTIRAMPSTGAASMHVNISKTHNDIEGSEPLTERRWRSRGSTSIVSAQSSHKSLSSATSTSPPATHLPAALIHDREDEGKYKAEIAVPIPRAIAPAATADVVPSTARSAPVAVAPDRTRTPLGDLNLTIERHTIAHETEYLIFLGGSHEGAVFRGRLSDAGKKSELLQCKGFRLRSSLRRREVKNKAGGEEVKRKEGTLRVHEVKKTNEVMILDISFVDAVIRMEVFWDQGGVGKSTAVTNSG